MPKNKKQKQLEQEQSDNQDSDDSQKQLQINTDNSPKIIPVAKLPDKLKQKKIVLNVSDTQYPIVTEVGQQLGWIIQQDQGTGDWDVWWTDREIQPNTLYRMNLHQKINHFPGIYVLARKNLLGLHLMAMHTKFPNDYNFFPQTWMLPMQFPQFRQYYQSIQQGKVRTYIVKPQALSQGRGIFLTRNIENLINGRKYVVQKYLKNPLLLDGLKFDLRIYVLLAGSQPLRLYIYNEGLARLATRPYQPPTSENLHQNYIHLTNYSLNKSNPDYVFNKSDKQMDVGHKRSLKGVYERLAKNGIDIEKLKGEIQECIIKTVISGLPSIRHQYKYCQPQQYEGNMCFHILGFDVMILDDLKPIVIEVNHTPSFQTGTPLDYTIKKNLIKDTLKLMRTTQKKKKQLFQKAKDLTKKRIQTGKRDIFKEQQRKQHLQKCQKIRDQQERQILFDTQKPSGYKMIFPFKDEKKNQQYTKFYQGAQKVMKDLKNMRKKIIQEENSSAKKQAAQPSKDGRKSKNSSTKEVSIQRTTMKRPSGKYSPGQRQHKTEQKTPSSVNNQECQNMQNNCGNQSSQNDKKKPQLDTIVQHHDDQHEILPINEIKLTHNTSDVCQTQKKIVYSSMNKNTFHIRNNNKVVKKNSFNLCEKGPFSPSLVGAEDGTNNSQGSKYQELMNKFVRSKDLQDQKNNRMSAQGQILLQQKFNQVKKVKSYNQQDIVTKEVVALNYFAQLKQKQKYCKNDTLAGCIKGYKQKIVFTQQNTRGFDREKFHDSHIVKYQQNKSSKAPRSYANQGYSNLNFINSASKPIPIQNLFSNFQTEKYIQHQPKQRDQKRQKTDFSNKLGKFLKPKTYNLHDSKFPQQDKFIVRVDQNCHLIPANHKSQSQGANFMNVGNMHVNVMSYQQYNDFSNNSSMVNNGMTTQMVSHGYGPKVKLNIGHQHRNVSTLINGKPPTSTLGHKAKSNSMVYKTSTTTMNKQHQPVLFKIIQKTKTRGYQ